MAVVIRKNLMGIYVYFTVSVTPIQIAPGIYTGWSSTWREAMPAYPTDP